MQDIQPAGRQDAFEIPKGNRRHGNEITGFGAAVGQGADADGGTFLRAQCKRNGLAFGLQAVELAAVTFGVDAVFIVDVLPEFNQSIVAEAGGDGAGLDQADVNVCAVQFVAQSVAHAFQSEFGAVVRAAPRHGGKAQNTAVDQDAAVPLPSENAHGGIEALPRAENVGFKLFAQGLARNVFHRADLPVARIGKECVERAARLAQNAVEGRLNAAAVVHIQLQGIREAFPAQTFGIFRTAAGREHLPTHLLQHFGGFITYAAGTTGDEDRWHGVVSFLDL